MTILYLADIRFPLERANGVHSMETCAALAERGHTVHMLVRPDTVSPPRDPFAYYGVPSTARAASLLNLYAVEHDAQLALIRDAEHMQRDPGHGFDQQLGGRFTGGDGLR